MTLRGLTKMSFAGVAVLAGISSFVGGASFNFPSSVAYGQEVVAREIIVDGSPTSAPPTLASMDYCADQYILALADKNQILALSKEATSVYSLFRGRAVGIPQLRGSSEDMLALSPDVVVRQWKGSPAVDRLFQRAGIKIIAIPFAGSPQAALDGLIAFGDQIGKGKQARTYAANRRAMRQRLATLPASGLKALYVTPSGYTAGGGTSVDSIIKSAGLDTMASDYDLQGWHPLPMESIIRTAPDVIITSFFDLPRPASRWPLAQNPITRDLLAGLPVIDLPASHLSCNGLFDIDAAQFIREKARQMGLLAG